ncbi:hypothetical protein FHW69_001940 [Luteibacter sp. Sphag1AF]|uniref:DUF4124 domain-containing protein n=1 Tax=Luteibacter sp. Sphag1AF TaxID=2587031 RepID=UPI0016103A9D|nr:DUF4124 domain-containing protein [Luteibacter sp. Sphag1AF]MBB3227317.1 hypothetical protein [Luteibacter sp. Sphag1AF]
MRRYLIVALLASVATMAQAQSATSFYKWKDAQGVTHYTDSPPPGGTKVEKVHTSGATASTQPSTEGVSPEPKPEPAKGTSGPTADTPENRGKLCETLKSNLEVLGKDQPVSADDGKGGSVQLDTAARQRQMETAQAQYTLYCKK